MIRGITLSDPEHPAIPAVSTQISPTTEGVPIATKDATFVRPVDAEHPTLAALISSFQESERLPSPLSFVQMGIE